MSIPSAFRSSIAGAPNPRLQRTRSASPPSPLSRQLLGRPRVPIFNRMASSLIVVSALSSAFVSAQQAIEPVAEPFVLDSTGSTYPFVMRLEGTAKRGRDMIEIVVKAGTVRSAIPAEYGEEGKASHVSIQFGLGSTTSRGWQMSNDSESQVISAELFPGETLPITTHRFTIRGLKEVPLADVWLAARLTVVQRLPELPAGPLSSYACLQVNLLGETPGSKDRAKRMATNYSKAC